MLRKNKKKVMERYFNNNFRVNNKGKCKKKKKTNNQVLACTWVCVVLV